MARFTVSDDPNYEYEWDGEDLVWYHVKYRRSGRLPKDALPSTFLKKPDVIKSMGSTAPAEPKKRRGRPKKTD